MAHYAINDMRDAFVDWAPSTWNASARASSSHYLYLCALFSELPYFHIRQWEIAC